MKKNELPIWNVNFRGKIVGRKSRKKILSNRILSLFRSQPPQMLVLDCHCISTNNNSNCKLRLIIFRNFKCRLMKCKTFNEFKVGEKIRLRCSIDNCHSFTCKMKILSLMSGSVSYHFDEKINLFKLSNFLFSTGKKVWYEPEIFQALRISHFNPLCVNIFQSGACVILGIKKFENIQKIIDEIFNFINTSHSFSTQ